MSKKKNKNKNSKSDEGVDLIKMRLIDAYDLEQSLKDSSDWVVEAYEDIAQNK